MKRKKSPNQKAFKIVTRKTSPVCMTYGSLIGKNRLIHSPFVKTCTGCQQTLENEAKESHRDRGSQA